ncbi:MAG: aldose epimerase family protein [Pseudomonadota bacterium]
MSVARVGTAPDGAPVWQVSLAGNGVSAKILSYGAVVQDLRLDGHCAPLVLGFADFDPYIRNSAYLGAVVGRYANRIAQGQFALDGRTHQLDQNEGAHHLHGGRGGTAFCNWQLAGHDATSVRLALRLPDGHMGFPGNMDVSVLYDTADANSLNLTIEAKVDQPSLANFAGHSYFCLDASGGLKDHWLTVLAETVLPVDKAGLPVGQPQPVSATPLDFRKNRALSSGNGIVELDHNFCLANQSFKEVARLRSARSGIALSLWTDQPGLQVYTGKWLETPPGHDGRRFTAHAGVALEPQFWPDAPNWPSAPSPVLRPGMTYRQTTSYRFKKTAPL